MNVKRFYVSELVNIVEKFADENFVPIASHGATKLWYDFRITASIVTAEFISEVNHALDVNFIVEAEGSDIVFKIPIVHVIIS